MKNLPALVAAASVLSLWSLCLPVASQAADAASIATAPDLFRKENLAAWCIVPFDRSKRNPEQRAEMLERIQLKKFVYDYRAEHVPQWEEELQALQRHGIELSGWMFNSAPDKEDRSKLNAQSEGLLEMFGRYKFKPQLWVIKADGQIAMPSREEHERRVRGEVASLKPAAQAAQAHGLKLGLYNHGGWWGEPENQIEIIEGLKKEGIQNVGIVYNLHHGHGHLERFPQMLQKMLPYLICLNLNGMDISGQTRGRKILPIGVGTEDVGLLKIIHDSGYRGLIGILNHTGEDAEARLLDNLDGLEWANRQLDGAAPGPLPAYRSWKTLPPANAPANP